MRKPLPFEEFRNPDGTFKHWLVTWRYREPPGCKTFIDNYFSPLPWVWHEAPDGEALMAYKALGYFEKLPLNWRIFTKPTEFDLPVYGTLFNDPRESIRNAWIGEQRDRFSTPIEFLDWCNAELCLFNKPKE